MPRQDAVSGSIVRYVTYWMLLHITPTGTRERNIAWNGFVHADAAVKRDWGW